MERLVERIRVRPALRRRSRAPRGGRSACRRAPGSTSCRRGRSPARLSRPGAAASSERRDVRARALRDVAADDDAGRDPAPDAEPALPDRERAPPLVRDLVPARREVVEPRADDAGADTPDRDAEDQIPVAAALDPAVAGEPDAGRDAGSSIRPYMWIVSGPRSIVPDEGDGIEARSGTAGILPGNPTRTGCALEQDLERELGRAARPQQVGRVVQVDVRARGDQRCGRAARSPARSSSSVRQRVIRSGSRSPSVVSSAAAISSLPPRRCTGTSSDTPKRLPPF